MKVVDLGEFRARRQKRQSIEMTTGEQIRKIRNNRGLSQDALGKAIGYSQPEISRIENNEVDITPRQMAAICRELGSIELMEAYWETDPLMELWREWNQTPAA